MSEKVNNPLEALLGANKEVKEDVYIKRLDAFFTVKGLDGSTVERIREKHTVPTKTKGGKITKEVNEYEFGLELIATACVNPDFNDERLKKHYGATDAADCVKKALLAGEIDALMEAVLRVSGYQVTDEMVDEAKNS